MRKQILLATAALMLGATPALADNNGGNEGGVGFSLNYANNIDTSIRNDTDFESDVSMGGYVWVYGEIDVDSSAVAISDPKQLLTGTLALNREADHCGCGDNPSELDLDASTGGITVAGNAGVNVAAGWLNQQANVATIAVSNNEDNVDNFLPGGGMAKANTTSLQSLLAVFYGPAPGGRDSNNFEDDYEAEAGNINANGNLGVNIAAGAFNQQSNVMSIATATNAVLAEATAGVVQTAALAATLVENPTYDASTGTIAGTGNIGVNVAAGVGNQQHNSLTVANSSTSGL